MVLEGSFLGVGVGMGAAGEDSMVSLALSHAAKLFSEGRYDVIFPLAMRVAPRPQQRLGYKSNFFFGLSGDYKVASHGSFSLRCSALAALFMCYCAC